MANPPSGNWLFTFWALQLPYGGRHAIFCSLFHSGAVTISQRLRPFESCRSNLYFLTVSKLSSLWRCLSLAFYRDFSHSQARLFVAISPSLLVCQSVVSLCKGSLAGHRIMGSYFLLSLLKKYFTAVTLLAWPLEKYLPQNHGSIHQWVCVRINRATLRGLSPCWPASGHILSPVTAIGNLHWMGRLLWELGCGGFPFSRSLYFVCSLPPEPGRVSAVNDHVGVSSPQGCPRVFSLLVPTSYSVVPWPLQRLPLLHLPVCLGWAGNPESEP